MQEHEELPLNSAFRPFVEELKNDIGVSGMMFGVETETGREFKYLDAPPQVKQAAGGATQKGNRGRRQSRLDIQMEEARTTGTFRTRQSNVAHRETDEQEVHIQRVQQEQVRFLENSSLGKEEKTLGAKKQVSGSIKPLEPGVKRVTSGHRAEYDSTGGSVVFNPTSTDAKEARRRNRLRKRKAQGATGEAALRDDLKMFPPVHKLLPVPLLRKFDSDQPDLAPRRRARPKVLIVDGNLVHLAACKHIYERYFEIVQCVPSADQAMDLLDHVVFDMVLIAPDLPGDLSGLDLVDAIRHVEEKSRHSFRALIVSICSLDQSKDQTLLDACFCSGMDRFLMKPAVLYVHLLCDLMVGGTSTDAFRRLALETQWVSHHEEMLSILGDDPNARAGVMSILQAEGTEEIQQRKVAALMDTDTDRLHVDGLHERQRKEELQRIVNATAQMKRRIVELEHEVEVLEEERARKAYTETRNLNTLLALETRLKEAERELHEKAREAQQHQSKAEDYRIDLKNLLDNGCVNAERVAKAKRKVQQFQRIMEACTQSAMEHLDAANQRSWNNYYGDVNHRSHFEIAQYVPQFATDTSASWYRSELSELLAGVGTSLPRFGKALDDVRSKLHRFIEADVPDVDAIINVLHDQLPHLSRCISSEVTSVKYAVETAAANMLIREIEFWKLLEDDEPAFKKELLTIKDHIVGLKDRLYDRTHSTQTEMFLWDYQTTKDLSDIAQEMMAVSTPDAGLAVDMETSYPRLPDGSYSAASHAKVEVFYLPIHMQDALGSSPLLQSLVPFLPIVRGDVFMLDKTRRTIFAHVFERLEAISTDWLRERAEMRKQLTDVAALLNGGVTVDADLPMADIAHTIRAAADTLHAFQRFQAIRTESRGTSPLQQPGLRQHSLQAVPSLLTQTSLSSSVEPSVTKDKLGQAPQGSVRRGQTPTTTKGRPSPSTSSLTTASTTSRSVAKPGVQTPTKAPSRPAHSPTPPTSHMARGDRTPRSGSPSTASVAELTLPQAFLQRDGDAPRSTSIDTPLSQAGAFIQAVPSRDAVQMQSFSYDDAAEHVRVQVPSPIPLVLEPHAVLLAQLKTIRTTANAALAGLCTDDTVAPTNVGEVAAQQCVLSLVDVAETLALNKAALVAKHKASTSYAASIMLQAKEHQSIALLADAKAVLQEHTLQFSTLQMHSLKSELHQSREELATSLRRTATAAPTMLAARMDAYGPINDALSPTRSPSPCANRNLTPVSPGFEAAKEHSSATPPAAAPSSSEPPTTPRLTKRGQPSRSHYIIALAPTHDAAINSQPLSPQPPGYSLNSSPTLALHGISGSGTPGNGIRGQAPSMDNDRPGTQGSSASTPWQCASPPVAQHGQRAAAVAQHAQSSSSDAPTVDGAPATPNLYRRRTSRATKMRSREAVDEDHFLPLLPGRGRAVAERHQHTRYVKPAPVFQGMIVEDTQATPTAYLVALSMQPSRSEGNGLPVQPPRKALADAFAKYGGSFGDSISNGFNGVPDVTPLQPKHLTLQRSVSPTKQTLSPDSCIVGSQIAKRSGEPDSPLRGKDTLRSMMPTITPGQPALAIASMVVAPTTAQRGPATTKQETDGETRRAQSVREPRKKPTSPVKRISRHELLAELMS